MKKYKFLILFITLFSLFSFTKVFARSTSNYNTNYDITINEIDFIDNQMNNDYTYREFLDMLSSLESNYYNIVITFNPNSTYTGFNNFFVYLFPKSLEQLSISLGGEYSNSNYFFKSYINYSSGFKYFSFSINNFNNITNTSNYNNLLSCLNNNTNCRGSVYSINTTNYQFSSSISNTSSYSFSFGFDNINNQYYYYSSIPIFIKNDYAGIGSSINVWYKNIIINGIDYPVNSNFPTYKDLFPYENNDFDINKELDNYNSLSNFYFRINKNDISNFSFIYEFNPLYALSLVISNPNYFDDFYNDLGVGIKYFGRKYDSTNNYYTYDEINCSLNHTYIKNSNTINSNGANLTCSTDLTDYDYVYLYIDQFLKSNDSINPTIKYVNLQVNGASYHYGDYIGFIYDRFDNLSSDFEMSFSSNETGFSSVYSNIDYGLIAEKVRVNNSEGFVSTALTIQPLEFSYDYKAYFVVFNDSNKYNGSRNIEFFTFPNTIISFSDKENNKFYIYDENKNINSVTARIQYYLNDTSSYDLNYYFKQVNDYINGLSVQITNLGNLTQNFYDNMPDFVQTFIFIAFILACIYFTYKLIKK